MQNHHGNKAVAAIVALAVGLAVGGGVGYATASNMDSMNNNNNSMMSVSEDNPNTMTKAADLRVTMNNLLREHVSTSLDVTRAIADGASEKELAGAQAAQTANAVAVADAVGSVFGEEAKEQITPMFVDHIEESNNYAKAVESGDEMAKEEAQKELDEYLDDISAFFAGAIPSLEEGTVKDLLSEHEDLLNRSVEAYNAGSFEESYNLEREALMQVSGIADAISKGTVQGSPDKF